MSEAGPTRRMVAEVLFAETGSAIPQVGNKAIHHFWPLLSPHFRDILLPPHRRSDDRGVTWTWRPAGKETAFTAAEIAQTRQHLARAHQSWTEAEEDGTADHAKKVCSQMKTIVKKLIALPDARLAGYLCRTESGLMLHSWGAPAPAVPFSPDARDREISGVLLAGDRSSADIEVVLESRNGGRVAQTRSDAQGAFIFQHLAPGNYRVRAISDKVDFPVSGLEVVLERNSVTGLKLQNTALKVEAERAKPPGPAPAPGADRTRRETPAPAPVESRETRRRPPAWLWFAGGACVIAAAWGAWRWLQPDAWPAPVVASPDAGPGQPVLTSGTGTTPAGNSGRGGRIAESITRTSANGRGAAAAETTPARITMTPTAENPATAPEGTTPASTVTVKPPRKHSAAKSAPPRNQPGAADDAGTTDSAEPDEAGPTAGTATAAHAGARPGGRIGGNPSRAAAGSGHTVSATGGSQATTAATAAGSAPPSGPAGGLPRQTGSRTSPQKILRAPQGGPTSPTAGEPDPGEEAVAAAAAPPDPGDQSTPSATPATDPKHPAPPRDRIAREPAKAGASSDSSAEDAVPADDSAGGKPGAPGRATPRQPGRRNSRTAAPAEPGNAPAQAAPTPDAGSVATESSTAADQTTAAEGNPALAGGRPPAKKSTPGSSPDATAAADSSTADETAPPPPPGQPAAAAKKTPARKTGNPAPAAAARPDAGTPADSPADPSVGDSAAAETSSDGPSPRLPGDEPAGPFRRKIVMTAWKLSLSHDVIVPTRPVPDDEADTTATLRATLLKERSALIPGPLRHAAIRCGFALEPGAATQAQVTGPHWQDVAGQAPEGVRVAVQGGTAEISWDGRTGLPPGLHRLVGADGHTWALLKAEDGGGWILETSPGIRSFFWVEIAGSGADRQAPPPPAASLRFSCRLPGEIPAPDTWSRTARRPDQPDRRIEIPLAAPQVRPGAVAFAWLDRASGWQLSSRAVFEALPPPLPSGGN